MKLYEAHLSDGLLEKLIAMSGCWEAEGSTYGYRKNDAADIEENRIFLAEENGEILGYLLGKEERVQRASSIMADGTPYFEIEELYVIPQRRSQGVGRALFACAEQAVKGSGCAFLMLSTATKDYKSILHFYIDELGMDFWSARLFKKL